MKEELANYETAKLAKEKGFDGPAYIYFYTDEYFEKLGYRKYDGETLGPIRNRNINKTMIQCVCPTQSILQRWLREKHNIHIRLEIYDDDTWSAQSVYNESEYEWDDENAPYEAEGCKSYEEALEVGLQEALKLIE